MNRIILFMMVHFSLVSCDKFQGNRWSGKYVGLKHCSSWTLNAGNTDTTYTSEMVVTNRKKYVQIAGFEIPVDSLRKQNFYRIGSYDAYTKFKFVGDSLYITSYSGGLGGGGGCTFSGLKK